MVEHKGLMFCAPRDADNIMVIHNAMEQGLMEYHHEKMKEINL